MRLHRLGAILLVQNHLAEGERPQAEAYRKITRLVRERSRHFAIYPADADEFLFLHRHRSIADYLDFIGDVDAIAVNWKFFGSNGHARRPKGLVMQNYVRHAGPAHRGSRTLKTICRFAGNVRALGVHFPHFKDLTSARFCYSDGARIPPERRTVKPHQNWAEVRYEYAAIHHYGLKSREEFDARRMRGRGSTSIGPPRHTDDYFARFDQNKVLCAPDPAWTAGVRDRMAALFAAADLGQDYDRSYFGL